ncbi:hypothetical protein ACWGIB_10610 [Streptomyces xiamenensis]
MPDNKPPRAAFGEIRDTIRELFPEAVVVRIYPEYRAITRFYDASFSRIDAELRIQIHIAQLIREGFGKITNWSFAHDFYVLSGTLCRTPEPDEQGYIPEDDRTFGFSSSRVVIAGDGADQ